MSAESEIKIIINRVNWRSSCSEILFRTFVNDFQYSKVSLPYLAMSAISAIIILLLLLLLLL